MDGVDQLNNILIIGMTNRKDMIDEALLRPGRLEVHMEISLPDEGGRYQILHIHTSKMRTNKVLDPSVDLHELASLTKNFSGAEIGGLIKSATSFAFNRHVKVGTMAGISDDVEHLMVNRDDFLRALDEVHPAFGVSEEELAQVMQNGIIHFNSTIEVRSSTLAMKHGIPISPNYRKYSAPGNSSWTKCARHNARRSCPYCFMGLPARARRRSRRRSHNYPSSRSSSLSRRTRWSALVSCRR